ncbi:MAG: metallophosphoesterase [Acidobacteria bacterium]|nr:metallophosphoesterase [Acidobacteriota bacterium]
MTSSSRKFAFALVLAILSTAGFFAYSYFIEPHRLVVNQTAIRISGLDPALNGLRVVVVSDIHAGSHGADREKLVRLVDTINRQNAELVLLLGDYLSRDSSGWLQMQPNEIASNLANIKSRYGVFAVLGNHDIGDKGTEIKREFELVGYRVLDGEVAVIEINGARLRLLGLRDHLQMLSWAEYSADARRLLSETEGTGNVFVLQHSPDVIAVITGDLLISSDLKLMVAGHTHGGQVKLPILGMPLIPSMYGQKYAAGHIKDSGLDVVVTTGVGTSILPFRFMVPPEIAVLTIVSE